MKVALHTKVRADRIEEYEQAHRAVPAELTAAIRDAGVTSWTIWRSGTDLFHVIECEDYPATLATLATRPVNVAWQARMAELLETVHDYSAGGGDAVLPVVWALAAAGGGTWLLPTRRSRRSSR
jgi:L-rhamnose mutarotase